MANRAPVCSLRLACIGVFMLIASSASPAQTTRPTDSRSAMSAKILAISAVKNMSSRYGIIKKFPEGEFQPWHMTAGSVIAQAVVSTPSTVDRKIVELLVSVSNDSGANQTIQWQDVGIAIPKHDKAVPFEFLFSGVVGDYDSLAHVLGLNDKAAADDKTIVKLNIEGGLSCDMKPKEKTWIAIVFIVPKDASGGQFSVGGLPPIDVRFP